MTRREEITKKALELDTTNDIATFVVAAKWADKTMIEKACSYLYAKTEMSSTEITAFRKAMEK